MAVFTNIQCPLCNAGLPSVTSTPGVGGSDQLRCSGCGEQVFCWYSVSDENTLYVKMHTLPVGRGDPGEIVYRSGEIAQRPRGPRQLPSSNPVIRRPKRREQEESPSPQPRAAEEPAQDSLDFSLPETKPIGSSNREIRQSLAKAIGDFLGEYRWWLLGSTVGFALVAFAYALMARNEEARDAFKVTTWAAPHILVALALGAFWGLISLPLVVWIFQGGCNLDDEPDYVGIVWFWIALLATFYSVSAAGVETVTWHGGRIESQSHGGFLAGWLYGAFGAFTGLIVGAILTVAYGACKSLWCWYRNR